MSELMETMKKRVKYWWVSLLIGILSIVLGIWCLVIPDATLVALTMVFIASFLLSGIMEISFAVSNRKIMPGWGFELTGGIIDLAFGIILIFLPTALAATVLIFFVGFWIMFRAIWGIGVAIDMQRNNISGWGWLLTLAILGVLFSLLFIISPAFGASVMIAFASVAFVFYGIFRIYLAFTFKSLHNRLDEMP